MNSVSIFDLSPSEKLRLVEDLWDDLAAMPETVPVHDWQKQELARRKAKLAGAAERPTMQEWLERTQQAKPIRARRSSAQMVRELRNSA